MKLIRVAVAVLNQTPMAWAENAANIRRAIDASRAQAVSVLCLPELCITGYGCEDAFYSRGLHETAISVLHELAPTARGMIVSVGLPLLFNNGLFNTACLLVDGEIAGFVAKRHLAGEGLHYEPRWFKAWPIGKRATIELRGKTYPIGDVHFDVGGVKLGFEICEDAWVASRPGSELSLEGVDLILNPSASHFAFGKHETRRRLVLEGSRAFGVTYLYSNLLGNEAGRAIYDGDAMIASAGKRLAACPRFSFDDVELCSAVIDVDATRMTQARTASFRPNVDNGENGPVRAAFEFSPLAPQRDEFDLPAWESGPHLKEEEFARAISLALFDYLRKSRSRGFVVSISGGADSAAVTCLVAMMVRFGIAALGRDKLLAKLAYVGDLEAAKSEREIVQRLLTCVYQSTANSSETTRSAARDVASAVGAQFLTFDVSALVAQYIDTVQSAIGRTLTWESDDITLQNIQARVRAPGAWMLANINGSLLLSTSNRSEAAVGYATMDGDTCGGLSPIAGIDKAFLRHWLRWLETMGPEGIGAIPALRSVNVQPPTAELRPPAASQTDEADLMPYDVLDAIERLAIRDKHTPVEVLRMLEPAMPQHGRAQLMAWVERFFRLWSRNQWKRERYAPSFHVDDENLDPKTWCRFPILSGGFERELAELRAIGR
ncbi:MAG: NAD(+) synthase [Phycisphaerae bacterium]